MGMTQSSVPSTATVNATLVQAAMDLEPAIVAFKNKHTEVEEKAIALVGEASLLTSISTPEDRELANEFMRRAAAGSKEAEEVVKPLKTASHGIWKGFCAIENALAGDFGGVRSRLEPLAIDYDRKVEFEAKLEATKQLDVARTQAEDEVLAEAEALYAAGDVAEALALLDGPVHVSHVLAMPAPKMAGESKGGGYEVEVFDLMALVKAVAAGTVPIVALKADESFLKKQANALKDHYAYPGTRAKFVPKLKIRA